MAQEYSSRAVRNILGISQRCLDYWAEKSIVVPSARKPTGKGTERRYSYFDLARLAVVKKLRDGGLSLARIQVAVSRLSTAWPDKDPLVGHTLFTDGRHLHRTTPNPLAIEDVLDEGQLVFSIVAVGRIEAELRRRVIRFDRRESKGRREGRQVG